MPGDVCGTASKALSLVDAQVKKGDYKIVINNALNATLSRTINTSMTIFLVLLAIFIFGGDSIRGFMFALIVGIVVGTYSSLFIATPLMYDTISSAEKRKGREAIKKQRKEVVK